VNYNVQVIRKNIAKWRADQRRIQALREARNIKPLVHQPFQVLKQVPDDVHQPS